MRLEHIDFESRTIRVVGKGDKERIVLFGQPAKDAILAYLKGRTDGFLFRDELPPRDLHVYRARPNRSNSEAYWQGYWCEGNPGVARTKWLGKVSEMTLEQALEKLAAIVVDFAQRPTVDKPLGLRHIYPIVKRAAALPD